ncbi:16S rRNA (uracil(1498)-N(3))-methyltransferase [Massilia glaciei]|uniref:Ribosomal RNA small subunit methyltransferase E n=1 Tax=Massilia glaciei TaxID=1524097 RepID=A0A2U2HF16_9BURK|nr:16S rRNA (uracil(1498)-N(3))-methyltransferase [Massilia glaciei]PWF42507.1 16S rRNA (uracil(1498)-N(3))-methyltransferase [Massilia glaciei]
MPRLYCPQPLAAGASALLPESVARHLHVLRLQPGAPLTLFNGDGAEYPAELAELGKRQASARVLARVARDVELPFALTLAQALPEASKMDWIVEKAVELGVAALQPLAAQRCVVRLAGERAEKRLAHWQGVVVAASEQSGRNRLARLAPVADFDQWIKQQDPRQGQHQRVLLTPRGGQSLSAWARHQRPQALTLLVGPEGGYTAQEEDAAIANGALALSMGPRVLRTETAGLAALAALGALWGAL